MTEKQSSLVESTQEFIARTAALADAEDRGRRFARNHFLGCHPCPVVPEEIEVAEEALAHERQQQRGEWEQEANTQPYVVAEAADPDAKRNPVEILLGALALVIFVLALAVVPTLASMLVVGAGKIDLVADYPAFGLAFGASALVGMLASVEIRSSLGSDSARERYDRALLAATTTTFIGWSLALALAAYPLEFGGNVMDLASDPQDWGSLSEAGVGAAMVGFRIETPMAVLFVITAVLDLLAAPVLHRFLLRRLTPRPLKRTLDDAEQVRLREKENPARAARVDAALDRLRSLRGLLQAWQAGLEASEEVALALLDEKRAEADAAADQARRQAFSAPHKPRNGRRRRTNGAHSGARPTI